MKVEGELINYLTCYAKRPDLTKAYLDTYSKYIHAAALQFGIPETLLTCLLFRESQFEPDAESEIFRTVNKKRVQVKGAIGIAQFMPETEDFISNLISTRSVPRAEIERLTDVATSLNPRDTARDKVYAQTVVDNYALAGRWNGYFEQLKSQGLYSGNPPTKFNEAGARDPKIAIGASAFYLRFMMEFFDDKLNLNGPIADQNRGAPDVDLMLSVAGSYNMGHGAAVNVLRRVRPASSKKWYDQLLKTNSETAGHMRSIRNCVENNNFSPMDGTPNRDCGNGAKP